MGRKTSAELSAMRRAGRVVAEMHDRIREQVRPGVTSQQLDAVARVVLAQRGARSNFLGYQGYPAVICVSRNDVVVHGIPDDEPLREGDVVSIDCGAVVDGYHGDAAFTMGVGSIDPEAQSLIDVTRQALDAAIGELVAGNRLGDVGHAVQHTVALGGFDVVRDYVGHGIGRAMHEEPEVPNYGRPGRGRKLGVGDVLAIEPMASAGSTETVLLDDGWTVVTKDGSLTAHWEHTVALTEAGPEILTRP